MRAAGPLDERESGAIVTRIVPFAVNRRLALRRFVLPTTAARTAALVGGLVLLSAALRLRGLDGSFWIDEGLSIGIASFPLSEIPGVLRQDGSPPLYYMLLHVWTGLFGTDEVATNALSLVLTLLAIPVALWAGRSLFGNRAGWFCAGMFALNPFVTAYAHETRMYSLMILLGLVAAAAFVQAFVFDRRGHLVLFSAALTLMLYTHGWSLFFGAASVAALALVIRERPERRRALLRDAALAYGAAALLFAPWLPTLLFQIQHTGAPWSNRPVPGALTGGLSTVLGGLGPAVGVLLVGGAGVSHVLRRPRGPERSAILALAVIGLATILVAWIASQAAPAWAYRYYATIVGPLLLLAAVGLARARRLGVATVALLVILWLPAGVGSEFPTKEREVTAELAPQMAPGDLVLSLHPERVPVLHHYLPPGLRYASLLGPVREPRVMDWRDSLERLRASRVRNTLEPILAGVPVGSKLLVIRPLTQPDSKAWSAPWTSLVRVRSSRWARVVANDSRFLRRSVSPAKLEGATTGVRGLVYLKVRD